MNKQLAEKLLQSANWALRTGEPTSRLKAAYKKLEKTFFFEKDQGVGYSKFEEERERFGWLMRTQLIIE